MNQTMWNRRQFLILAGVSGLAVLNSLHATGSQTQSAYSQKVLSKNPVGYWRLGESSIDQMVDASPNGRDGVFHVNPVFGETGPIQCDTDKAIKFNNDAYAEVPNHMEFSQPTSGQGLTVEVWMRPDLLEFTGEQDGYVHWLGKGENGKHEWAFRFYRKNSTRPNRISAYIWNPAGGLGAGAYFEDALPAGEWIHIVAAYDPGDKNDPMAGVSIYKNGVFRMGPGTSQGAKYQEYDIVPNHGAAPLRFGTRDLATFLIGALDEVAIYPRVLSATEILDHYQMATEQCAQTPVITTTATLSTPTSSPSRTPTPIQIATLRPTPLADHQVMLPIVQR